MEGYPVDDISQYLTDEQIAQLNFFKEQRDLQMNEYLQRQGLLEEGEALEGYEEEDYEADALAEEEGDYDADALAEEEGEIGEAISYIPEHNYEVVDGEEYENGNLAEDEFT
jgi:hypothetical protein